MAWTFWLIYVVDNYYVARWFLTGAGLFFRRSAHLFNQQAAVNVFSTETIP